jgi:hypothetical protein
MHQHSMVIAKAMLKVGIEMSLFLNARSSTYEQ